MFFLIFCFSLVRFLPQMFFHILSLFYLNTLDLFPFHALLSQLILLRKCPFGFFRFFADFLKRRFINSMILILQLSDNTWVTTSIITLTSLQKIFALMCIRKPRYTIIHRCQIVCTRVSNNMKKALLSIHSSLTPA